MSASRALVCCTFITSLFSPRMLKWRIAFFFQAEDGIRDSSVTGVQTCALPISTTVGMNDKMQHCRGRFLRGARYRSTLEEAVALSSREDGQLNPEWVEWLMGFPPGRSEERRVGKEGRSRWSPYH